MKKRSSAEKAAWIGFAGLVVAALITGLFKNDININIYNAPPIPKDMTPMPGDEMPVPDNKIPIPKNKIPIPETTMKLKKVSFINKQEGDIYHSRLQLQLIYQAPPTNIYLAVFEKSVQDVDLAPMRTGMSISGHSGKRQGYAFTNLQTPFPELQLDIFSSKPISLAPEKFRIEYDIT